MTHSPVSDTEQFEVALTTQVRSYLSTYRFWAMLGLVLAIGGGISLYLAARGAGFVAHHFLTATDYIGAILVFVAFLAIVVGAFFGGDAISTDFGTKTGYYILAQPVKRSVLLSGRYVAAFLVSSGIVAVYYLIAMVGGIGFFSFGAVPWESFGLSFLLALLLTAGVLSFAFSLSSLSRSPAIGLVITIIVLLVGLSIIDDVVTAVAGTSSLWFSILYAAGAIPGMVTQGISGTTPPVWQATAISAVYAVGFAAVAYVLYQREET